MKGLYLFIFTTLLLSSTSLKLIGIDLSKWDETVYWDKLKKDVKFVILRNRKRCFRCTLRKILQKM